MGISCKGIVINSYDFREKDKIIVVFTDNLGKIKIIARGVKGIRSLKRESLMLMSLAEYEVKEGKNFYKLGDVHLLRPFKLKDYENYEAASFYLKLLNRLLPDNYINSKIFQLTDHFLLFTENMQPDWKLFVSLSYVLKFLYLLGDFPSFRKCVCGEMKGDLFIDTNASQIHCEECSDGYQSIRLSKKEHKYIETLLLWDYSSNVPENIDEDDMKKVAGVLYKYMKYHFNQDFVEIKGE